MKLVIFGLSVSSSWGNGHATIWRALTGALARRGHQVIFFERDVPYYAAHRDLTTLAHGELCLYDSWPDVRSSAARHLREADVGIVTSYCPDGPEASAIVLGECTGVRVFYDLDTPVTLARLGAGERVSYLPADGLGGFDLVLSYTGGRALSDLQTRLGARQVAPLYGAVDPTVHRPARPSGAPRADLSHLGTYAEDRQPTLDALFIAPARRLRSRRFLLGGAQYPQAFPWTENIYFRRHVPPAEHPVFYADSALTLNVTRRAMAAMGYCPSGRLFEAAACGVPLLSDVWEGLDAFLTPGREILIATTTEEAIEAIESPPERLAAIAEAARERVLSDHTAERRVVELEGILESVRHGGEASPELAETAR